MDHYNPNSAILCVDDEVVVTESLRLLFSKHLKTVGVIEVAQSSDEAFEVIQELEEDGIDLQTVIVDYIMPGIKGDELLARIHQKRPKTKKIMLTGQSDIAAIKRAINEADLYRFMEKPWNNEDMVLTTLGAVMAYRHEAALEEQNKKLRGLNDALERKVAERTWELKEKNLELERIAATDFLTGLYNRVKLDEVLAGELRRSERYRRPYGVILMDIDYFKRVNDQHGHQVGDQVLKIVADLLRKGTRETDIVGRWGGEEFMIFCPEIDRAGLLELAEKVRRQIEQYDFPCSGSLTSSFGLTLYTLGDTMDQMILRTDTALYEAKKNGRNQVQFL